VVSSGVAGIAAVSSLVSWEEEARDEARGLRCGYEDVMVASSCADDVKVADTVESSAAIRMEDGREDDDARGLRRG
jgi:hypothetical protein